jgi:hypothetical protein
MAYREKCLLHAAEQFGGKLLPELNDPEELAWRQLYLIWAMGTIRETFRLATDFWMSNTGDLSQGTVKRQRAEALPDIERYIAQGSLVNPAPSPSITRTKTTASVPTSRRCSVRPVR